MEQSVTDLLANMTLEEKASLCSGADDWNTKSVPRLGIPSILVADGPNGLRKLETESLAESVLGKSIPATCFPPAVGSAGTWNRELLYRMGEALGIEARANGVSVLLGPGVNIKRSPLCGRNFEYFSEDPLLAGELGTAFVNGVQSQGVGSSLKHFAANNQETERMRISAQIDESTLRQIYLSAFERVVSKAQPWTVMCSYNRINEVYSSQNPWLLTQVLREEWGFTGIVVSDWGAVDNRVAGVGAGLDLEMPSFDGRTDAQIVQAVRAGELAESVLDKTVTRILELVERSQSSLANPTSFSGAEHHKLAQEVAQQSAVLLRNEAAILPLNISDGSVAVIGELARTPRYQGAGSSQVIPTQLDNALDSLRAEIDPTNCTLSFCPGYALEDDDQKVELQREAVQLAQQADTVLLFLGLPPKEESEGFDRSDMGLPLVQLDLLDAIAQVNSRIIVVLSNGASVEIAQWQDKTMAIIEAWLLGQAGGSAITNILLGKVNPSGRLAESIPVKLSNCAAQLNFPGQSLKVNYGEGPFVGYRGYLAQDIEVAYPFGHGLSYTNFEHSNMTVNLEDVFSDPKLADNPDTKVGTVAVTVKNTGNRTGMDVVQLYVSQPQGQSLNDRIPRLAGFATLELDKQESREVLIDIAVRDIRLFSELDGWVIRPGAWEFSVGKSCIDFTQTQVVQVERPVIARPLTKNSTLSEWMNDSAARNLLFPSTSQSEPHTLPADLVSVMGSLPLIRFASFPQSPFTVEQIEAIVEALNKSK